MAYEQKQSIEDFNKEQEKADVNRRLRDDWARYILRDRKIAKLVGTWVFISNSGIVFKYFDEQKANDGLFVHRMKKFGCDMASEIQDYYHTWKSEDWPQRALELFTDPQEKKEEEETSPSEAVCGLPF